MAPRQNRLTPFGELVAVPERGRWMGNRGCLHDAEGRIVAFSRRDAWVTCLLQFRSRHRQVMAPGRYTELFFLDEVTALAAGHRPCATCRRKDYDRFKRLWLEVNGGRLPGGQGDRVSIAAIDRFLAAERTSDGKQRTWSARLGSLPDGTMVALDGTPCLVWRGGLHRWTFSGYTKCGTAEPATGCRVLTPRSVVEVLRAGYVPDCHPSAG